MPAIKTFKGIIYNLNKLKDFKKVVSPPYDIISSDMQERLYRKSPYNIVRLILGKIKKKDDISDNRYSRAKKFFDAWLRRGVLVQDEKGALYVYLQRYRDNGRTIDRVGFIGLMELKTEGKTAVLPHENTLLAPKLDRLNLMRSTNANLEPIFVLYEDSSHSVLNILKKACAKKKPIVDIESDGVIHRVWRVEKTGPAKKIDSILRSKDIFIADGHHRYEVARTYSIETQGKDLPDGVKRNSRYIMSYFVELNQDMLTILPTHRLIKDISILKKKDIRDKLARFFDIEKASSLNAVVSKLRKLERCNAFGVYFGRGDFSVIKLKSTRASDLIIKNSSKDWKRLDVTILHLFLLEYVLGIRDDEDNIAFLKDPKEAISLVDKGKYKIAFFLNPTKVHQVKRIAKLGEKMPRKATYFYPKPLSGLVMNKF